MIPESELLHTVLANVVGFDINPLAVITARVNFLLALGDLLEHRKGPITIPVYLADSVLLPELGEDLATSGLYQVHTSVGVFKVPETCFSNGRFDGFCTLLEESVRSEVSVDEFVKRVTAEFGLSQAEHEAVGSPLRALYEQLLELHQKGLDGLWARLLKNNFAPLTVGQFDYVIGNPPWVNWENLPDGYRNDTKALWDRYGLFPHVGMDVILGKGKKDIAMLMAYVAMDRFLKPRGKLGFVITQSLFKTAGAGQGFRRFRIGENGAPLGVVHVDDMVDLKPFEGASNRTAVMVIEKGRATRYPVPYTVWKRKKGARFSYDSTLEDVKSATRLLDQKAEPVDPADPTSPWLTADKFSLAAVKKVLGKSDYTAHAGAYTGGANGVYWVRILSTRPDGLVVVENITEGAKREVPKVTAVIEPDLLYPLLRGRDVKRWHAEPSAYILMVQDPRTRRGIPEDELRVRYPKTWKYLKRFEPILRERRSRGVSDMLKQGAPFYTMFAVGDYTFAPWKVVWPWIAKGLRAAVIDVIQDKPIVPEHNTFLVACHDSDEAFYICALMNSSAGDLAIRSFFSTGGGGIGSPIALEHIRIPKYDPADLVHQALAAASQEAHAAAAQGDANRLAEIEDRIDHLAAQLWDLTDRELASLRRGLPRELPRGAPARPDEEQGL